MLHSPPAIPLLSTTHMRSFRVGVHMLSLPRSLWSTILVVLFPEIGRELISVPQRMAFDGHFHCLDTQSGKEGNRRNQKHDLLERSIVRSLGSVGREKGAEKEHDER